MSMYAEERQQAMARLLVAETGRLSVNEIADRFDVTTETVRRDLSALERIGLVRRVHGGAVPASALAVIEAGVGERDLANTEAKDKIAEAALDLSAAWSDGADRRRVHDRPAGPASLPATCGSRSSPTRSPSPPASPVPRTSTSTCSPVGSARRPRPRSAPTPLSLSSGCAPTSHSSVPTD